MWGNYPEALVVSKYINMPAIPEGKEQKGPTTQIKMLILHIHPLKNNNHHKKQQEARGKRQES